MPAAPEKPAAVAKWVTTVAEIRARETVRQAVADELLLTWERATAEAGLAVAADYCARLADHFAALVEEFDELAWAPRTITGHEDTEQVAAHTAALRAASAHTAALRAASRPHRGAARRLRPHTAALRAASALTAALVERAMIADAAHEAEDIGPDPIWLCLAPHPTSTRDGIDNALETFKHRIPQTLTEWDEIRPLAALRLAAIGEVAARRERHSAFMYAARTQTPDMGQRDHSYGEIENNPPAPQNARVMQRETDRLFDQATPYQLETTTPQ